MAVVKADAYGHGAVPVARAALGAGANWLGTAHISEALALRAAGIEAPLLAWLHTPESNFAAAVAAGIDIGCSGWELERIVAAAREQERPARVHLKVDTGLGRNGATLDAWDSLVGEAMDYQDQGLLRVVGIFSHLAVADEPERPETDDQLAAFREALAIAQDAGVDPEVRHLANTPATLSRPDTHFDLVRVGLGLYGLSPFDGQSSEELGLRPAMTVRTVVSHCKDVPAGQGVSYGLNYRTGGTSTLGLIPLGYADGVPRIATGGPVRVGGRELPGGGPHRDGPDGDRPRPAQRVGRRPQRPRRRSRAVWQRRRRRAHRRGLGPGGRHQQLRDRHADQPPGAAPLHQRRARRAASRGRERGGLGTDPEGPDRGRDARPRGRPRRPAPGRGPAGPHRRAGSGEDHLHPGPRRGPGGPGRHHLADLRAGPHPPEPARRSAAGRPGPGACGRVPAGFGLGNRRYRPGKHDGQRRDGGGMGPRPGGAPEREPARGGPASAASAAAARLRHLPAPRKPPTARQPPETPRCWTSTPTTTTNPAPS